MIAHGITPILNVSDLQASVAWFAKLGWTKRWEYGEPPDFASVGSGAVEIFLCLNGQGGRGRGANTRTFGPDGNESADQGSWMSIWVESVDSVHDRCLAEGLEVVFPPTDLPWNTREMHVRHPDGHVLRISAGMPE